MESAQPMTIEWTPAMDAKLGVVLDVDLAKEFGISRTAVRHRRLKLCIGPAKFTGKNAAIVWTVEMDRVLGSMPDTKAAAALGVSRESVASRRRALGVPDSRSGKKKRAPIAANSLILTAPTSMQVKQARESAGLTLKQAAALAGSLNARAWLRYESAERKMGVDRWALFLLALGQHPHYKLVRNP